MTTDPLWPQIRKDIKRRVDALSRPGEVWFVHQGARGLQLALQKPGDAGWAHYLPIQSANEQDIRQLMDEARSHWQGAAEEEVQQRRRLAGEIVSEEYSSGTDRPELTKTDSASPVASSPPGAPATDPRPPAADAGTSHVTNIIIASQGVNIASASPNTQQSAHTEGSAPGDMTGLIKALIDAGVPASEAEALKAAIGQESGQAAKQKYDSWLKRIEQEAASGAWSLVKGVTIDTLRKFASAYLSG